MLERLRPMALGHVPLKDMLGRLVNERVKEHPHIAFLLVARDLRRGYGDSIDLTVYRCVQESVTNAIRHAAAKNVVVKLDHIDNGAALALTVTDDGRGLSGSVPGGFGTRGMKERVAGYEAAGVQHVMVHPQDREIDDWDTVIEGVGKLI